MTFSTLAGWAAAHPLPLAVVAVLAAVLVYVVHRVRASILGTPVAVRMAAFGAMVSTAYSSDTSWSFARDHLHMSSLIERGVMFAAAELGLLSMALMARQNLKDPNKLTPGAPGVLVWVITAVMVIPAYSESGIVAGTVRAFVGPIMAALLWHIAMGIELRHASGDNSQALTAVLARELRERLLSRLGLAERGRDAVQISRDRWTRIATVRAAHLADLEQRKARIWRLRRARARLASAVDHTDAAVLPEQRTVLLERISAYRQAGELATIALPSPWLEAVPQAQADRVPGSAGTPLALAPEPSTPHSAAVAQVDSLPTSSLFGTPAEGAAGARAEYVPEGPDHELGDDSPPPPGEDTLTAGAREEFAQVLASGVAPSIRTLKSRYGIGQTRATRIRTELETSETYRVALRRFNEHVAQARIWIQAAPDMTGAEADRRLGGDLSEAGAAYGERVLAAAQGIAPDLER